MPTTLPFPPLTLANLDQHMAEIEGGTFEMGGESLLDDAKPIHTVKVSAFALCRFPVTQSLWQAVMGDNPSYFRGALRPVEQVSWEDCHRFIREINQRTTGGYRLPSEAEWEYAARGGRYPDGTEYASSDHLDEVAWYDDNSLRESQPVGRKRPNALGLYDMSGNVWEWCQDHYHNDYKGAPSDGTAWEDYGDGAYRVLRGGSWYSAAVYSRVAYRAHIHPRYQSHDLGFRLARSIGF